MRELFDQIELGMATSAKIVEWSYGEVKKPETINYRSLKPEKDGLFDERIFGPLKDWECYCGKYKRYRYQGIVCEKCRVEVTRKDVRRERMGHIELPVDYESELICCPRDPGEPPVQVRVVHIWYFKSSYLSRLLDMSPKDLEKVIYFAAYVVTWVDEAKRAADLPDLEAEMWAEVQVVEESFEEWEKKRLEELENLLEQMEEGAAKASEISATRREWEQKNNQRRSEMENEKRLIEDAFNTFRTLQPKQIVEDEELWRAMKERYGSCHRCYFRSGKGGEAVYELLMNLDLDAEMEKLREEIESPYAMRRQRAAQRIKVVKPFWEGKNDLEALVPWVTPVIPPELRPMVQLDGGRFATSDLNDLYRRVINRNNRLRRLLSLKAPRIIINNEKRMLQESVDALFDNGRRGRAVTGTGGAGGRPLKSLTDLLKGKSGRFRQNLLGKRVDYSGRSVIVAGPQLKLHQCGLPKAMALELFKPFVMKRLVDRDLAQGIKSAKRMVERQRPQVWEILREIIKDHPVLLNRAPTLHRLGIQAFEPLLVEGKAIQIHPLVCEAFNADFDGDQMAVHLPLSPEAQAEARVLMLSTNNVRSPASGDPVVTPSQDMVIGLYYLSSLVEDARGAGRSFADLSEAFMAYDLGELDLHAPIRMRMHGAVGDPQLYAELHAFIGDLITDEPVDGLMPVETTLGRALINHALPDDFPLVDALLRKSDIRKLVAEIIDRYDKGVVQHTLDGLKELGFLYSTRAGLTVGINDVLTPKEKPVILSKSDELAQKVESQFRQGIITRSERAQKVQEIWSEATDEVTQKVRASLSSSRFNPIDMMMSSGARGNIMQVRQMVGMRGLVVSPGGEIVLQPIKSNFREGMSVLEYFSSTHGARKGLTDTALRTADAGYFTRRLVDVAQEVIVSAEESEDRGIKIEIRENGDLISNLRNRIFGRVLAADVRIGNRVLRTKEGVSLTKGAIIDRKEMIALAEEEQVTSVTVRSPLTDEIRHGISQASYGLSMATGKLAEPGEAVGVIAAQSIGEPGTQLTMRTFHTGGVDTLDITHGLPRVVELFEARSPKGKAILSIVSGKVVKIEKLEDGNLQMEVEPNNRYKASELVEMCKENSGWVLLEGDRISYNHSPQKRLLVKEGDEIEAGDQLTEGPLDPKDVLRIKGVRACQRYLVDQVQEVYRSQGVDIHDKHIELIVRQMLRKVLITRPNDIDFTDFPPGDLVDQAKFRDANRALVAEGKRPAEGRPELMGITKASLATDSWLSAASFQETSRVLTDAAVNARSDYLRGLKENVIIGKLVPSGTGTTQYQQLEPELPFAEAPRDFDGADFLASREAEIREEMTPEADDAEPEDKQLVGAGAGESEA